jgi:hypothetical protein
LGKSQKILIIALTPGFGTGVGKNADSSFVAKVLEGLDLGRAGKGSILQNFILAQKIFPHIFPPKNNR